MAPGPPKQRTQPGNHRTIDDQRIPECHSQHRTTPRGKGAKSWEPSRNSTQPSVRPYIDDAAHDCVRSVCYPKSAGAGGGSGGANCNASALYLYGLHGQCGPWAGRAGHHVVTDSFVELLRYRILVFNVVINNGNL